MKFSQFNDLEKVRIDLDNSLSYLKDLLDNDSGSHQFLYLGRVNMLFRKDANVGLFWDLTQEYRRNTHFPTKVLALGYVALCALLIKLRLARFVFKVFTFDAPIFYPVILGGNNRYRLIDSVNKTAILVAKSSRSEFFTSNAIRASSSNYADLGFIPAIYCLTRRVYLERQIRGMAVNRMSRNHLGDDSVERSLDLFFDRQKSTSRTISCRAFFRYKIAVLTSFSAPLQSKKISSLVDDFSKVADKLSTEMGLATIEVSLSHGDLNRGNVFIDESGISIIDWEFFLYRYIDYDRHIYFGNLRHRSLENYNRYILAMDNTSIGITLFLMEEYFFRILNYKDDLSDSEIFLRNVKTLLDSQMEKDKPT
jgi:hypothetical protein